MATIQERCANFLAQGLKPAQVASVVGISPGRLSQIAKEPSFPELLAAAQERYEVSADEHAAAEVINNKYIALESKILDSIESTVHLMDPRDQIKALEVVGSRQEKARQRMAPQGGNMIQNNLTVQLALPAHAVPEYRLNSESEIVSIDGKPMAPLNAPQVKSLFASMKAAEQQEHAALPQDF